MPNRTLIIGDVHGCFDELMQLVQEAGLTPEDDLITLGDVIVKGPKPREVLDWLHGRPRTRCILGNMEWRLLQADQENVFHTLQESHRETLGVLGAEWPRWREWLRTWPLWVDVGDHRCIHAGLRPGRPMEEQSTFDLLHIRGVKGRGGVCGLSRTKPWWEVYEGPPRIVFGHTPMPEPLVRRWAIGLDTGCVKGGRLTGLWLPEERVVSVRAAQAYVKE